MGHQQLQGLTQILTLLHVYKCKKRRYYLNIEPRDPQFCVGSLFLQSFTELQVHSLTRSSGLQSFTWLLDTLSFVGPPDS